jgi:trigger factor
MEIGSGGPQPEMTDELRDMKPGESRTFTINYPKGHASKEMAGRRVAYTVALREIKEKVLPDMNDELAADLGDFTSLADLRQHVEKDLLARETRRTQDEARGELIDALLKRNPDVPAPDAMVEEELDRRLDTMARAMALQGLDPREARVDWGQMRERQREAAARGVRAVILLDAIAEEEKISLEPEALHKALSDEAARRKQTVEALKGRLAKEGRLERLERELLREKVLDFLLVTANI